jgi:hypothetical protein
MRQAIRQIIDRLRQREPIIFVACVVLLALIASAWLVGALQRLFGHWPPPPVYREFVSKFHTLFAAMERRGQLDKICGGQGARWKLAPVEADLI